MPWYRMGVYAGEYTDPRTRTIHHNAVIQAANPNSDIIIISTLDGFTNYGLFPFVDCKEAA